jgi:hypothetical protein
VCLTEIPETYLLGDARIVSISASRCAAAREPESQDKFTSANIDRSGLRLTWSGLSDLQATSPPS